MEGPERFPYFLHGGDYNPEQWEKYPDILEQDISLMKKAHINCVSLGIFAWSRLEPEEGVFDFSFFDSVVKRLTENAIRIILATPSGGKPQWMAQKYPEVLRVTPDRRRMMFSERHNHCLSSPVFRQKVKIINTKLAERYASNPNVILWHLSNEYSGECHCELCQQAFREWLKNKYKTLDSLNEAWWNRFWSHTITDWSQIQSPSPIGEQNATGLLMDWKRFVSWQTARFAAFERECVKGVNPALPVTTNLMASYKPIDYFTLSKEIDLVSWDSYPPWHSGNDTLTAVEFAANHDLMRSLKKQPFLLMESTPSQVNWEKVCKLKRPHVHLLSSMQAVAHGAQSVMYFQWRKSRGSCEMFHGAVVDHYSGDDTRTFSEVRETGTALEKIQPVYHTGIESRVCIVWDWENWWALDTAQAALNGDMQYVNTLLSHYQSFWKQGISVDFCNMDADTDLSSYQVLILPLVFMFRNGFEKKIHNFVENGGTVLMTYWSGVVDDRSLAFLGGRPHALMDIFGLRCEELDALYPDEKNQLVFADGKTYTCSRLCDIIKLQGAEVLAVYGADFYKNTPAFTRNHFGKGTAYYLASQPEQDFLDKFYHRLAQELCLPRAVPTQLPDGVTVSMRKNREDEYFFIQNYVHESREVSMGGAYIDLLTNEIFQDIIPISGYGVRVLYKHIK